MELKITTSDANTKVYKDGVLMATSGTPSAPPPSEPITGGGTVVNGKTYTLALPPVQAQTTFDRTSRTQNAWIEVKVMIPSDFVAKDPKHPGTINFAGTQSGEVNGELSTRYGGSGAFGDPKLKGNLMSYAAYFTVDPSRPQGYNLAASSGNVWPGDSVDISMNAVSGDIQFMFDVTNPNVGV